MALACGLALPFASLAQTHPDLPVSAFENQVTARNGNSEVSVTETAPVRTLPTTEARSSRFVTGSVGLGNAWALTGSFRLTDGWQSQSTETSIGLRYSTRAGDQFIISVEPTLSWYSQQGIDEGRIAVTPAGAFTTEADILGSDDGSANTFNFGASATVEINGRWYVSGLAHIEQTVAENGRAFDLKDSALIGGFLTGVRF